MKRIQQLYNHCCVCYKKKNKHSKCHIDFGKLLDFGLSYFLSFVVLYLLYFKQHGNTYLKQNISKHKKTLFVNYAWSIIAEVRFMVYWLSSDSFYSNWYLFIVKVEWQSSFQAKLIKYLYKLSEKGNLPVNMYLTYICKYIWMTVNSQVSV